MSDWNSNQYLMFENERTQPAIDLVNRICVNNAKKILDIGCGPGNSTKVLYDKFPKADVTGIDNSENMIEKAKEDYPQINFEIVDAENDLINIKEKYDVVFSNACIQWIPHHKKVLKDMMSLLNENGILAVQIPYNYDEPIHRIISEVTKSEKWKGEFKNPRIFYNLSKSDYFDLLSEISEDFSMWDTVYYHKLNSHEDILEWYRGTGLRPYLSVLSDEKKIVLENDILKRIKEEYPVQKNGQIIFRFPRLFFIAKHK